MYVVDYMDRDEVSREKLSPEDNTLAGAWKQAEAIAKYSNRIVLLVWEDVGSPV